MGAQTSKEVRLPVAPEASSDALEKSNAAIAEYEHDVAQSQAKIRDVWVSALPLPRRDREALPSCAPPSACSEVTLFNEAR